MPTLNWLAPALLALTHAPGAAYAAGTSVDIFFLAPWSAVEGDNMVDFKQQFTVMMIRTEAVAKSDITAVLVKESENSNVLVTVALNSVEAGVKLLAAVEGRHLSVYIDGRGYIGVIPKNLPTQPTREPRPSVTSGTTEPPETSQATRSPQTPHQTTKIPSSDPPATHPVVTQPPSERGYVWLNEYTSDNENMMDCSTGSAWSGVVISRMPTGCHRFQHQSTSQDEYNFLALQNGQVSHFGMVCDPRCTSCISQHNEFSYGGCVSTWGGSVSVSSGQGEPCIGASYIDSAENSISIFSYSDVGCDIEGSNMAATLYIRNYPPAETTTEGIEPTCTRDGTTARYYALSRLSDENGNVFFNGKLGCSDDECTKGCTEVKSWQEGACNRGADGNGIRIWESADALNECVSTDMANSNAESHTAHVDANGGAPAVAMAEISAEAVAVEPTNNSATNAPSLNSTSVPDTTNSTTARPSPRPTLSVPDETLFGEGPGHKQTQEPVENEQLVSVLIAAGGVMAVAFLVAGVLHSRRRRREEQLDIEDEEQYYSDEYDYNGYSKYNTYDYEDDRLITDI